jgi:hypothetical protein
LREGGEKEEQGKKKGNRRRKRNAEKGGKKENKLRLRKEKKKKNEKRKKGRGGQLIQHIQREGNEIMCKFLQCLSKLTYPMLQACTRNQLRDACQRDYLQVNKFKKYSTNTIQEIING